MAKKEKKEKKEKKIKKEKKNKKSKSKVEESLVEQENLEPNPENLEQNEAVEEIQEDPDAGLTESQKAKKAKLDSVKSKISKILKASNVEIVDENAGDDFDDEESSDSEIKKQQDYDSLKSAFGKGKNKKQELTLTIDDFDYTYVGKYVDEYDLMHKKNIKKIKLPSKYGKIIKKIAIAVIIVSFIAVGIFLGVKMTSEKPYHLISISLSQTEQTYFANEEFDFTGLYLYAHYSNGKKSYTEKLKLDKAYFDLQNSGGSYQNTSTGFRFLSESPKAVLAWDYYGAKCSLNIKIKTKKSDGITANYMNGLFELKADDQINAKNLFVLIDYNKETNYNSELLAMSNYEIYIGAVSDNKKIHYNSTSKSFVLDEDLSKSTVLTVVYNGYSVELVYVEGATEMNVVSSKTV